MRARWIDVRVKTNACLPPFHVPIRPAGSAHRLLGTVLTGGILWSWNLVGLGLVGCSIFCPILFGQMGIRQNWLGKRVDSKSKSTQPKYRSETIGFTLYMGIMGSVYPRWPSIFLTSQSAAIKTVMGPHLSFGARKHCRPFFSLSTILNLSCSKWRCHAIVVVAPLSNLDEICPHTHMAR